VADIKPIFDTAISRLKSVPRRDEAFDYDEANRRIVDIFQDVYTNGFSGIPLAGRKPFYVFDAIGQLLDHDKTWRYIIGTLGDIGAACVKAQKPDLAMMAFQQALETASKRDPKLFKFKEELGNVLTTAKTSLQAASLTWQTEIRIYDFFLSMLRILDRSDPETTTKEAIAQILEDKGDTYGDNKRTSDATQMYRQAIETYKAIRAKSESKYEWDNKITDLENKTKSPRSR
jgi:tetratricopeptide (TPR) repeat protein